MNPLHTVSIYVKIEHLSNIEKCTKLQECEVDWKNIEPSFDKDKYILTTVTIHDFLFIQKYGVLNKV